MDTWKKFKNKCRGPFNKGRWHIVDFKKLATGKVYRTLLIIAVSTGIMISIIGIYISYTTNNISSEEEIYVDHKEDVSAPTILSKILIRQAEIAHLSQHNRTYNVLMRQASELNPSNQHLASTETIQPTNVTTNISPKDKAREFARSGNTQQAKMEFYKAKDLNPEDKETAEIMMSMDNTKERGTIQTDHTAQQIADAEALFRDGTEALQMGDVIVAAEKIFLSYSIVSHLTTKPIFFSDLMNMAARIKTELTSAAMAISKEADEVVKTEFADDYPAHLARLYTIRDRINRHLAPLKDLKALSDSKRALEQSITATLNKWLSIAISKENLQGCKEAMPVYREIVERVEDNSPILIDVQKGIKRCE